jgi:hypothetical protein
MHSPEQNLATIGTTTEHFPPRQHSRNLLCYQEMIEVKPPAWRIENLIPDGSTAVLFGESNAFKSFVAVDIGCSVAVDVSYHGLEVKPGTVVYVASESAYGIATKRIPAWMAHHKIPSERRRGIYLRPVPPLLDDAESLKVFKADLVSVGPIAMLIYDVLAGTMKGSEKDTDVIARWVRVVGEIEEAFGCSQLFVTHSPYGDNDRIRGGTHLWGSFGTRLKAEGDRDKRTTLLSVERHKDHDSVGLCWGFKLEVTDIDEFPETTSLVPVKDDAVKTRTKTAKLTAAAEEVLRSFRYAIAEGAGQKIGHIQIPAGIEVLTVNLWRLYFEKLTTFQGKADARRKRFDRGIDRLNELRLVAKWDDYWWLTDAGKAVP